MPLINISPVSLASSSDIGLEVGGHHVADVGMQRLIWGAIANICDSYLTAEVLISFNDRTFLQHGQAEISVHAPLKV